jgi:hypothetical protein
MSTYFTDAAEYTRRTRLDECRRHHEPPRRPATARTRVAARLRRVADQLEQ